MTDGALQNGDGGLLLFRFCVQFSRLGTNFFRLHVLLPHPLAVLLTFSIQCVQLQAGRIPLLPRRAEVRLQLAGPGLQLIQVVKPHGDLQKP